MSNENIVLTASQKRAITNQKKRDATMKKKGIFKAKLLVKNDVIMNNKVNLSTKEILNKILIKLRMHKYIEVKQLGLKYRKLTDEVLKVSFSKPNMSRKDIFKVAETIRKIYRDDGKHTSFEISLKFDEAWRTGQITDENEAIDLFNPVEYEEGLDDGHSYGQIGNKDNFDKWEMFIIDKGNARGGDSKDKYNHCLFFCLRKILDDKLPWDQPSDLKKYLKIDFADKIDIKYIPQIEKKLNLKINVVGDFIYKSSVVSNLVINLELINEHYTLLNAGNPKIKKLVHFNSKKILIFEKSTGMGYDGENKFMLSKKQKNDLFYNKDVSEFICVNKEFSNVSFETEYNNYIEIADNLIKESDGLLNLYKTSNYKTTALNLFDKLTRMIETEPINQVETEFIKKSSCGALIFGKLYEGEAYKFDVKSFYPSMMHSNQKYPVKEGEYKNITTDEINNIEYPSYGIYKCIITKSETINDKLFRFNPKNHYTHMDLRRAKELDLKIEMIEDDEANFLYYAPDKLVVGSTLFGKYIDAIYPLKVKGVEGSKMILNILWGSLTQMNITKQIIKTDEPYILNDNMEIENIKQSKFNDDELIIKKINNKEAFIYDYARLKPFLLSKGRATMGKIMEPYKNTIVRVHTDGVVFSEYPKNIKIGSGLGELKYEGKSDNFKFTTCNDFSGDFTL